MSDCVEIPLRNGGVTLVSPEDADCVSQFSWWRIGGNAPGLSYAVRLDYSTRKHVKLHRFLMQPPPDLCVDHKDRDGLNNRRSNLRVCTLAQNQANRRKVESKFDLRGVFYEKARSKYRAQLRHQGHRYVSAYCETPEEAGRAYDALARKYFGDFANLNFPESANG